MIQWSFKSGWDQSHGGLFYMLDAAGYSPIPLEWDMKLWWPHTEAMIAFLWAYLSTPGADADSQRSRNGFLQQFCDVTRYSLRTFHNPQGSWYGYMNRENKRTHRFVGGPYKGFFHVPRGLFLSFLLLDDILALESKP